MWLYEQKTGILSCDKAYIGIGYSGKGDAKNNPDYQDVKNVGCIPRGQYSILPPRDNPKLGHYVLPLVPSPDNEMFGRNGFAIHGDSITKPGTASEGCIILPLTIRQKIVESNDNELKVI